MKILQILADADYDASSFETEYDGQKVSDIIKKVEDGEALTYDMDGDRFELNARVYEVGDIDDKFLNFIRNEVQDYDDSKHSNFYLETEIIKN